MQVILLENLRYRITTRNHLSYKSLTMHLSFCSCVSFSGVIKVYVECARISYDYPTSENDQTPTNEREREEIRVTGVSEVSICTISYYYMSIFMLQVCIMCYAFVWW